MGGGYLKLKDTNKESGLVSAETLQEDNLVGVYIEDGDDYTKVDQIPDSGYTFNSEESYCKIGDELQDMTITYDINTKTLNVTPMTKKGTKCYLYFDKKPTLKDTILVNNKVNSGTPDFSQVATTDEGIYKAEDDWGESYYYRGAVDNNWVSFAGYYWRIIRINGDGSIRIIYDGTSAHDNGESSGDRQTETSTFSINSSTYSNNAYVGYMYTLNQVHGLETNSGIKIRLDSWYQTNIANKGYVDKVSTKAGFCGDREPSTNSSTSNGQGGTGITFTYYGGYIRLVNSTKKPTLKCKNNEDIYTLNGSGRGNKALTNPVGLITADEVAMAGGVYEQNNKKYYLYTGQTYWTMSPHFFYNGTADMFIVHDRLGNDWAASTNGVRPVINLAHDVVIKSGNGTISSPYEV